MPYLGVKMNIGTRVVEEILEYAEIAGSYAHTISGHGRHALQCMDFINILEAAIS